MLRFNAFGAGTTRGCRMAGGGGKGQGPAGAEARSPEMEGGSYLDGIEMVHASRDPIKLRLRP